MARPTGEVVAGNTRLKAAQSLGLTEVPVAWFEGSDIDATAYQIADNKTADFATWDDQSLAALLETLRAEDALEGVGFSDAEIDQLLADLARDLAPQELDDPGPCSRPRSRSAGWGTYGCSGSTGCSTATAHAPRTLARLMAGRRRTCWPPIRPTWWTTRRRTIRLPRPTGRGPATRTGTSTRTPRLGIEFFDAYLRTLPARHVVPDAAIYQWHATRRQALVEQAWQQNGLLVDQTMIWSRRAPY